MTNVTTSAANTQAIAIDFRLLDNRYMIELNSIIDSNLGTYEERSARIALDRKYAVVREALTSLYDLGIQHNCNLRELLENYNVVVGQAV